MDRSERLLHPTAGDRSRRAAALRNRDAAIAHLAQAQHGVVSRTQLHSVGLSDDQIQRRLRRTLWPCGPQAFAVGHPGLSRIGRAVGALLHTGDGSALSHLSAARILEIVGRGVGGVIHVSVSTRDRLVLPDGVQIHRPAALREHDVMTHKGLRVTTPERTVADLLPSSTVAQVTRMLEQMVTRLDRSPDELHRWGQAQRHLQGKQTLLRALDNIAGPAVIRSEFESLFRSVCQEGGLPPAETNHRIDRWEVDAVWLRQRVAVELDSYRWHGGRWQFHQDRKKGLAISQAGFELLRISWPQLKHERAYVIQAVRAALERGASRSS